MSEERRVLCRENKGLADYVLKKKGQLKHNPKGLSEFQDKTFLKGYRNVCEAKYPIHTLEDLSLIKGFGKWMVKHMKAYFDTQAAGSDHGDLPQNSSGKKAKEKKGLHSANKHCGLCVTNNAAQAPNEKDFMHKQQLIDAADASGLSHVPIAPEKGKGKAGLGHSKKEWYSGWSCMTTLIHKGLVVKFSNPAKYRLTDKGREVAIECMMRSGLSNPHNNDSSDEMDLTQPYTGQDPKSKADSAGPSRAQTRQADILSDDEIDLVQLHTDPMSKAGSAEPSRAQAFPVEILSDDEMDLEQPYANPKSKADSAGPSRAQPRQVDLEGACAKTVRPYNEGSSLNQCLSSSLRSGGNRGMKDVPRLPPLEFGEVFEEAYDVILILDDREQFVTKGNKVENIRSEFKIKIEVKRLPVGDCIWIARHKYCGEDYVLDFIVERKNVDDMRASIIDNRYKDQKLRLQRLGFKKLMYILEGDVNQSNAADSIKTACFTTEILEGFDVLRTQGLGETLRKYGYLTKSIYQYYESRSNDDQSKRAALCPSFDSFVKRCQDLDKMTISDVFAIQLMQVPQVTEEIAITVVDKYKTFVSLASAYSHLEGDISAQEEMLRNQSNNVICASASKNIFKLVWG